MNHEFPTAIELRRAKAPLCLRCNHRSRMVQMFTHYAWRCRWGHVVSDLELCNA